jgi:hypothetical protein
MSDGVTMTNAVIECILSRGAARYHDPAATEPRALFDAHARGEIS